MVRRFNAGNNVQMGLDYRGRSVAAVNIHRKETTVRKGNNSHGIFNKQGSLTELPRKLNLVTTACNIYGSQVGCDAVSNVGSVLPYVLKDL